MNLVRRGRTGWERGDEKTKWKAVIGDVYCRIPAVGDDDDGALPAVAIKELSVAAYRNGGARWGRPALTCGPSGTIFPLPGRGSTKEREKEATRERPRTR